MDKKVSFKTWFEVNRRGFSQAFAVVWKYFLGKALVVAIIFIAIVLAYELIQNWCESSDSYFDSSLSEDISVHGYLDNDEYYLYNAKTDKKTLKHLDWVRPYGDDTLAVVCAKGKRGYVNRFTGEVAIAFQYAKAWNFSQGMAAVADENNNLWFIDKCGNKVFDHTFSYDGRNAGYMFHGNYCLMNDNQGKYGIIDRQGNWKVQPIYNLMLNSETDNDFWIAKNIDSTFLLNDSLQVIARLGDNDYYEFISENRFVVTYSDRPGEEYAFDGTLVRGNLYYSVTPLFYCEDDYTPSNYSYEDSDEMKKSVRINTGVLVYQLNNFRKGLMDVHGNRITNAEYGSIEALSKDVFRASLYGSEQEILIDRNGRQIP